MTAWEQWDAKIVQTTEIWPCIPQWPKHELSWRIWNLTVHTPMAEEYKIWPCIPQWPKHELSWRIERFYGILKSASRVHIPVDRLFFFCLFVVFFFQKYPRERKESISSLSTLWGKNKNNRADWASVAWLGEIANFISFFY